MPHPPTASTPFKGHEGTPEPGRPMPAVARSPTGNPSIAVARSASPQVLARAKRAYGLAERRRALLGDNLFSDPAWNMLLDLFISECAGRRLSVSAVCIGSRSSQATALRYASLLGDAGLVGRTADLTDGRRSYVRLTDRGWAAMEELLSD